MILGILLENDKSRAVGSVKFTIMGMPKSKSSLVRFQKPPDLESGLNAFLARSFLRSLVESEIEVNPIEEGLLDQDHQCATRGASGIISAQSRMMDRIESLTVGSIDVGEEYRLCLGRTIGVREDCGSSRPAGLSIRASPGGELNGEW